MGCDTKIYLPPNVRIKDVATVIGILSGCDDIDLDIEVEPKENKDYEAFQKALWNLKPIE